VYQSAGPKDYFVGNSALPSATRGKNKLQTTQHVQKWARTPFTQRGTGLEQVIALKLQDQTRSKFIV